LLSLVLGAPLVPSSATTQSNSLSKHTHRAYYID
jgi:hypothetical protein